MSETMAHNPTPYWRARDALRRASRTPIRPLSCSCAWSRSDCWAARPGAGCTATTRELPAPPESAFRDRVSSDGSVAYPAEAGRYHLYGSLACPWVHRSIIVRRLKGLEDAIG